MRVLKIQLILIAFIESLAQHLPHPIAARVKPLVEKWCGKVRLHIMREVEGMKKDAELLRREISEMRSATHRIKRHPSSNLQPTPPPEDQANNERTQHGQSDQHPEGRRVVL